MCWRCGLMCTYKAVTLNSHVQVLCSKSMSENPQPVNRTGLQCLVWEPPMAMHYLSLPIVWVWGTRRRQPHYTRSLSRDTTNLPWGLLVSREVTTFQGQGLSGLPLQMDNKAVPAGGWVGVVGSLFFFLNHTRGPSLQQLARSWVSRARCLSVTPPINWMWLT